MQHKLKIIVPAIVVLIIIILILCVSYNNRLSNVCYESSNAEFQSSYQMNKPGAFRMSYTNFDGSETRAFNVKQGNKIKITYNSSVKNGTLSIDIKDSYGNILTSLPVNKSGSLTFVANITGTINIVVIGNNTSGSFKVLWRIAYF